MSKEAKAKVAKAGLPAGVKLVGGKVQQPLDAASIRRLLEGWEVKRQIEALKTRLEEIQQALVEAHGLDCALVVTGVCRASLVRRQSVTVADGERLKGVLGARFDDLVKTRVSYTAAPGLLELATDADEPLQPAIAACLEVSESTGVTWRAEK